MFKNRYAVRFPAINAFVVAMVVMAVVSSLPCFAQVSSANQRQQNQNGSAEMFFFTNHGCAPCRQVEPGIQALVKEGYPVTTVYLNDRPEMGRQFSVTSTPTVILVSNNKIAGRHAGLIDGVTLKKWFAAVGVNSGSRFGRQAGGTKVALEPERQPKSPPPERFADRSGRSGLGGATSTVHIGTRKPASQVERRALESTIRLKVEDPEGISYATGTVIHQHGEECLVMTCGHVFRDANGKGEITAEFGFENGRLQTAPGQLIFYDAKARDIGLVAIKTNQAFESVPVAFQGSMIERGQTIFSIGCDHGEDPTIRRSQIKNRAAYDGAIKYDIYGRPVDGRSGGGLFNQDGELIGICNAAAVEVDEGIYTALETIHWQIAQVKLEHLFQKNSIVGNADATRLADRSAPSRMQVDGASSQTFASASNRGTGLGQNASAGMAKIQRPNRPRTNQQNLVNRGLAQNQPRQSNVSWDNQTAAQSISDPSDMEVIIIVRSKSDPSQTEAITVSHPSAQLLGYLDSMQASASASQPRQIDVAQLRKRIAFEDLANGGRTTR